MYINEEIQNFRIKYGLYSKLKKDGYGYGCILSLLITPNYQSKQYTIPSLFKICL